MALKDVLVIQPQKRPKTWLETTQQKMTEEDYAWLLACLNDFENFSGAYIAKKLTEAGYPISITTINQIRQTLRG